MSEKFHVADLAVELKKSRTEDPSLKVKNRSNVSQKVYIKQHKTRKPKNMKHRNLKIQIIKHRPRKRENTHIVHIHDSILS